jgi:hypothetical protein
MKKPKTTEVPVRKTKLDRIAAQIHTVLKRATKDVIEIGKLLIKSRALQGTASGNRGWPRIST